MWARTKRSASVADGTHAYHECQSRTKLQMICASKSPVELPQAGQMRRDSSRESWKFGPRQEAKKSWRTVLHQTKKDEGAKCSPRP
jgi:hypothetical protein